MKFSNQAAMMGRAKLGTGQPPVGRCEDKRRPPESLHENRAHPRLILQETESKQEFIVGNKLGQKLEQEPLVGYELKSPNKSSGQRLP